MLRTENIKVSMSRMPFCGSSFSENWGIFTMEKMKEVQKIVFMEGIEKYKKRGIPVVIDGKDFEPEDYEKLLEIREDGSFYMGDYIEDDIGILTEIRYDRVYYK